MSQLIKKAQRGNRDAMSELYLLNRDQVYYLSYLLLGDFEGADDACVYVFKKSWDYLLNGGIESESEFSEFIIRKTVHYCKSAILKKDSKALRIPVNKSFSAVQYVPDSIVADSNFCVQIIRNMPVLHRFIYVLSAYSCWSEEEIAVLLHTKPSVIKTALESEQIILDRLLLTINQKTGQHIALNIDEFHTQIRNAEYEYQISGAVNSVINFAIDGIIEPIKSAEKQKTKKIISIAVTACLVFLLTIFGIGKLVSVPDDVDDNSGTTSTENPTDSNDDGDSEKLWLTEVEDPTHYAVIEIADYGTITVALDGNTAPETVENFVTLANSGFYDGLTFHRIIEGFMMQGGDPNGDGTGGHTDEDGNEVNITGEFNSNGYDNYLSHVRGAISMARASDYDSASSQFFIVHEDSTTSLDGLYAAFGYVIDGMDVVDAVCETAEPTDSNGSIDSSAQPVIAKITAYTAEEYEMLNSDNIDEGETAIE